MYVGSMYNCHILFCIERVGTMQLELIITAFHFSFFTLLCFNVPWIWSCRWIGRYLHIPSLIKQILSAFHVPDTIQSAACILFPLYRRGNWGHCGTERFPTTLVASQQQPRFSSWGPGVSEEQTRANVSTQGWDRAAVYTPKHNENAWLLSGGWTTDMSESYLYRNLTLVL